MVRAGDTPPTHHCPACGTPLDEVASVLALCPHCLLELALESPSLLAEVEDPAEARTLVQASGMFARGQILGDRYRVRALLGRGGMGEVWRAFDLKLRVDVALKALHHRLLTDERALEMLRQEVRTAREVVSSNVCRVYDLVEFDGQELVSMEYVDGITLLDILKMRAPLELTEAREIASQFLAGLEAIHAAGLVHRDVKPENLMMTRAGRVVVMDFGIAKGLADSGGTVSGTPAYMAPEQARGESLTARADVYSAGVVLVEMIAPGGLATPEARQAIWRWIREDPPRIPDSPWEAVLSRSLASIAEQRHASAAALARALEEVTLRIEGDEGASPYPGLASFTLEDAEYFFGRELEVEEMWKKLQRPHLLGLIGPSGAGKSSFLRAGLLPVVPTGWRVLVTTPGGQPFTALGQALISEFTGDTDAMKEFLRFEELEVAVALAARWRERHDNVLLIVDQFEELFTQNPSEVQDRFAELLGRLAVEANVRVLLSMRDDFLFHCSEQPALSPMFSELTPLRPPTGSALRRALVQPALKCGYRFEDDSLVDEMVSEVADARGALPMLAFAAASLWEHRDRDRGLLTRAAYEHIGGVAGALARHAETSLETVGQSNLATVRELFRNLVTSHGTRAVRNREDLLSVFAEEERAGAAEVLDTLINERLLTTYEVAATDDKDAAQHRVEIIHESLLSAWPRLVRWQTQDTEGAQLREELRQAAQMWEQHSRSQDLLWTGTAFGEFQLWRERYPGGLSEQEEAFATAMTTHAERRRRRRRIAVTAVVVLALLVAAVTGGLWLRSEAATRRAEAARLLGLAQLGYEEDPTEALAYTTASLELADTEEARLFALRLLWEAPPVLEMDPLAGQNRAPYFSPDGTHLAVTGHTEEVRVWTAEAGEPIVLPGHERTGDNPNGAGWASNELLVTHHWAGSRVRVWSFPGGKLVREIDRGGPAWMQVGENRYFAQVMETDIETGHELYRLRSWHLPNGEVEELGTIDRTVLGEQNSWFDFDGSGWVYTKGNEVLYRPLPVRESVPDRLVGRHVNEAQITVPPTEPDRIWTRDAVSSELRLWDLASSTGKPLRIVRRPANLEKGVRWRIRDPSGRWADSRFLGDREAPLWSPEAWREARSLTLRRSGDWGSAMTTFHPRGQWFVASTQSFARLTFWPLTTARPQIADGYRHLGRPLAFSPDGRWLATSWTDNTLRLWPLPGSGSSEVRTIGLPDEVVAEADPWHGLAFDPLGRFLVAVGNKDSAYIVPLDGLPPRRFESFSENTLLFAVAVSPSGRRVATAFLAFQGPKTLRVLDLETDELSVFDLPVVSAPTDVSTGGGIADLVFADERTLYTAGDGGVRRWNLETGVHEVVYPTRLGYGADMAVGADGRTALVQVGALEAQELISPVILDLSTGEARALPAFVGNGGRFSFSGLSLDASGIVAAVADAEGVIRVGRVSDGEPHLLLGHEGPAYPVEISPDGRWIASAGDDATLRLWPMPDLDKPPLQTLPLEELLAKLKSLTNIRVVRDPESADGWKVTLDPFPGWAEVPTW